MHFLYMLPWCHVCANVGENRINLPCGGDSEPYDIVEPCWTCCNSIRSSDSAQALLQEVNRNWKNALHTVGVLCRHRCHCSCCKSALNGATLQIRLQAGATSTVRALRHRRYLCGKIPRLFDPTIPCKPLDHREFNIAQWFSISAASCK